MRPSTACVRLANALAVVAALLVGCGDDGGVDPDPDASDVDAAVDATPPDAAVPWPFDLPEGMPTPRLPAGVTLTPELAELGRHLFYDVRLSANQTQACASCHEQARAFTDGRVTSIGSTGDVLSRNAMSLVNVAYNPSQTWANNALVTLEQQAVVPIFGTHPLELGATGHEEEILARFAADPAYVAMFAAAFPGEAEPIDWGNIVRALSAFQRRLISGDSRVDRYRRGDLTALNDSERRGLELFFTERLECHHCHGGFNFTLAYDYDGLTQPNMRFFNTGLYNVGGTGDYPSHDQGLYELTYEPGDRGRFKPPTLRNIALTGPYMHDGSVATLEEVIAIYERGGRLIESGPYAGDGKLNPNKNAFVGGFELTDQERADLIAFLHALTDDAFIADPTLSDPFAD